MNVEPEGKKLLLRLMSAATKRRDILANNIASQNLPGYRRRDVAFEELLQDALSKGASARELSEIRPEIQIDFDRPPRADGNNVSAEEEASLLRENRIRFELYAMILKGRGSLITQAITADR
jgi:flagellar basal-body rod protein FlgB